MHLLGVALSLSALLVFANAFVARPEELIQNFEVDDVDVPDSGKCLCDDFGCWCRAWDDNMEVHVIISVDEFRRCDVHDAIIYAKFFIANEGFEKNFTADRFEDFCETVRGKRFCFRVNIKEKPNDILRACLFVSRPDKLKIGCFKIPMMSEECALQRSGLEQFVTSEPPSLPLFR